MRGVFRGVSEDDRRQRVLFSAGALHQGVQGEWGLIFGGFGGNEVDDAGCGSGERTEEAFGIGGSERQQQNRGGRGEEEQAEPQKATGECPELS